jgi:acetyl-CoA acetyltransferase
MGDVRVAGVGSTPFGEHPERTARDLFAEAGLAALDDAGVTPDAVEGVHYGNFMSERSEGQGHAGPLMAEAVGVDAPATRFESACASAGVAVREAVQDLRNGEAEVALVGGSERMTHLPTAETTAALAMAADALWEVRAGLTFPGAYALMADAYFREHGVDREDLAHVAVKNHDNALVNDRAQFQREITVAEALAAPMVAEPLGLYDSCPVTDGAAAVVLATADYAERSGLDAPVGITGTGQGGDRMALQGRASLVRTPAAADAAAEAYADASVEPEDADLAEVHDCFTVAEALALEALSLYDPGEAAGAARRGETTRDGDLPVNLSGGLKAKGHPVGATGASQVVELTKLLRGDHPRADAVPDATTGLAHNAGGTLASATVHVLEVLE